MSSFFPRSPKSPKSPAIELPDESHLPQARPAHSLLKSSLTAASLSALSISTSSTDTSSLTVRGGYLTSSTPGRSPSGSEGLPSPGHSPPHSPISQEIDEEDNRHFSVTRLWTQSTGRSPRPWRDPSPLGASRSLQRRKSNIPPEQTSAYIRTYEAVQKAASDPTPTSRSGKEIVGQVIDGASVVVHDILDFGSDALGLVPIPGLATAAATLLKIWDCVDQVESNRMSCLHLTERCAHILTSVREEVALAGQSVVKTLQDPLQHLIDVFDDVLHLMKKQAERPFIKRYLKRGDIASAIKDCHEKLTDTLTMFGLAVEIRMFKEIQDIHHDQHSPSSSPSPLAPHTPTNPESILPHIVSHHADRFAQDIYSDSLDLTRTIQAALRSNNDAHLIEVLQVEKMEMKEAIKTLQRALEDPRLASTGSGRFSPTSSYFPSLSGQDGGLGLVVDPPEGELSYGIYGREGGIVDLDLDTEENEMCIHREFIEEEIGALRRISGDTDYTLPPWTITRWEIDRDKQIGIGFYSEVYKGLWRGRPVAIKILAPTTPSQLFLHEAEIWRTLKHPNILELLGASSTSANPPWFFVSPYLENGSLVRYLKDHRGTCEPLRFIHEIAVGMCYLHEQGVLHGDLKAVNVLIDNDVHCVLSDFGQSEMKEEAYRLSGTTQPRGTLRWLAPEAMDSFSRLTPEVDVYSFAICCLEILTHGDLPWPNMDDVMVRYLVYERDQRPAIPHAPETSFGLETLIRRCWARSPSERPSFHAISQDTRYLLNGLRSPSIDATPKAPHISLEPEGGNDYSPSLVPREPLEPIIPDDLLLENPGKGTTSLPRSDSTGSFMSVGTEFSVEDIVLPIPSPGPQPQPLPPPQDPLPDIVQSPTNESGETSSASSSSDKEEPTIAPDPVPRDQSPPPEDDRAADRRNERRYRLHLTHPYHPSLTLPLWSPSAVQIGDVGYLNKPRGNFIRLFNAFDPEGTSSSAGGQPLPALSGVPIGVQKENKRSVASRGLDLVMTYLPFRNRIDGAIDEKSVSRRYSFQLRAGHKRAILVAESTVYRYMPTLESAKAWFSLHVDNILHVFGPQHRLHKEDIVLVIGTLDTQDYGLFINHHSPDGQVHFNVFSDQHAGAPFGAWSIDTDTSKKTPRGPTYEEPLADLQTLSGSKVSTVRTNPDHYHTLILARLRFKPDSDVPTSL